MAGPPASAYYDWGETTKFTCGPSVAGGAAATALMKDPDGGDVGLGVRAAGGCKCVTTVRTVALSLCCARRLRLYVRVFGGRPCMFYTIFTRCLLPRDRRSPF